MSSRPLIRRATPVGALGLAAFSFALAVAMSLAGAPAAILVANLVGSVLIIVMLSRALGWSALPLVLEPLGIPFEMVMVDDGSRDGSLALLLRRAAADPRLRVFALARLYLDNFPSLQVSWPTMGPEVGQVALRFGGNDFGSAMIEENVVSQAGAVFKLSAEDIERYIREAGFEPRRRNMHYERLAAA